MSFILRHHENAENGSEDEENFALGDCPNIRSRQTCKRLATPVAQRELHRRSTGDEKANPYVVRRKKAIPVEEEMESIDDPPEEQQTSKDLKEEMEPVRRTVEIAGDHGERKVIKFAKPRTDCNCFTIYDLSIWLFKEFQSVFFLLKLRRFDCLDSKTAHLSPSFDDSEIPVFSRGSEYQ